LTSDKDFILEFLPLKSDGEQNDMGRGVLVAAGFLRHGFKMGPLIRWVMADLVLTGIVLGIPLE
jgi:hypothetical protein